MTRDEKQNTAIVLLLAAAALLPMFFRRAFTPDPDPAQAVSRVGQLVSLALPGAALLFCWKRLTISSRSAALGLFVLLVVAAGVLTYVHVVWVDNATYPTATDRNVDWQQYIHETSVALNPGGIPHSYRFLPNSITRVIERLAGSYPYARNVYRFTFTSLWLLALYQFASLFIDRAGSIIAMLLCCLVYPVTIYFYAGQLADPLSYLSFTVCFIALETGSFPYFLLALGLGGLAKESVVAMLGYYLLFPGRARDAGFWGRAALGAAVAATVIVVPRLLVNVGTFHYSDISEVDPRHFLRNLRWRPLTAGQLLFSVGVFLPFVALGWSGAQRTLRRLVLFLLPVLFVANTMFSWLWEVRNFVPVIIPMAVIAAGYLRTLGAGDDR